MLAQLPVTHPTCPNATAQGQVCGRPCDEFGMHLENCAPAGGLIARHDGIVRCIGVLGARALDPRPRLEQIIPELARPVQGQMGQARLDVVLHDGVARSLVDVVVVSPYSTNAAFMGACARRDGHASRRAAIAKRTRYPTPDLVPFALETGGRIGTDARALLVRMSEAAEEPAKELQYLYRAISSVLQDGVARQLEKIAA